MTGETNLATLLGQMEPMLQEGEYVFCANVSIDQSDWQKAIGSFREKEGMTIIIDRATADKNHYAYQLVCAWITLTVHSSLEAVGLTAVFSSALARAGISCNVVAAYYHDHIFVPQKDANKAMEVLQQLSQAGGQV